ncbi:MAG: hypothetical protein Ct9H90mP16_21860 [Candidatus Poseidoniales archaeon]|nr:MAG: hypothetical protein Ct9H90mP16_21860 [Candidatus Poseidoniales archaeon]
MFEDWGLFLILEEFILMFITFIAAIWSLAKGAHQRGFKMFNKKKCRVLGPLIRHGLLFFNRHDFGPWFKVD